MYGTNLSKLQKMGKNQKQQNVTLQPYLTKMGN